MDIHANVALSISIDPTCFVGVLRPVQTVRMLTEGAARHMMRHAKRDEEAGGPGMGVLETRKRTRRAGDGTIITRPRKRQSQPHCSESTTASSVSVTSGPDLAQITLDLDGQTPHGAPVSPPGSASDPPSLCFDDHDPLLAPMMPGGAFEPFVEPIPGQFDAADGAWSVGLDGTSDFFSVDTGALGLRMSLRSI